MEHRSLCIAMEGKSWAPDHSVQILKNCTRRTNWHKNIVRIQIRGLQKFFFFHSLRFFLLYCSSRRDIYISMFWRSCCRNIYDFIWSWASTRKLRERMKKAKLVLDAGEICNSFFFSKQGCCSSIHLLSYNYLCCSYSSFRSYSFRYYLLPSFRPSFFADVNNKSQS